MAIITNRRKVQRVANMATRKATKKAPKPLDIITKRTKMNLPKRKSSTIAKIRKATTRNMAASTNSTNRRKANTRKVIIISPISIKDTKAKRDIIRKAITMTITRDTRANMVMISTMPMKNIMERKVAKRVAAKKDTNPKDINHHCNRNVSHIFSDMKFSSEICLPSECNASPFRHSTRKYFYFIYINVISNINVILR